MMIGRIIWLLLIAAPLTITSGLHAQTAQSIPIQIADYELDLPMNGIQRQSLDGQILTTTYEDGSELRISIVPREKFGERTTIPAAEYLKDLFGDAEPSTSILQVLRDRETRNLQEKRIEKKGKLTLYILTFPNKTVAYIADDYQPEYFVSVETQNRPLQPIMQTLTGGKLDSSRPLELDLSTP